MTFQKFACSLIFLTLVCHALGSRAQEQGTMLTFEDYQAIVALVFPPVWKDLAPENSHNIVLRFSGDAISNDLQILIYGQGSDEERYEIWRMPKGKPSIYQQIDKLSETLKTNNPKAIASSIHIEHFVIHHPSKKLKEVARQFTTNCFPLARTARLGVDLRQYSFWLKSGPDSMFIDLWDGDQPSFPLIQWMWALRTAAEDQISAEKTLADVPKAVQ